MTQTTVVAAATAGIAFLQLGIVIVLLRRRAYHGVNELVLLLGLLGVYTITASLLYVVDRQNAITVLNQVQFISLCFVPFANLNFLLTYYRTKIGAKRFMNGFTLSLSILFTILHFSFPFHPGYDGSVLQFFIGMDPLVHELYHLHTLYQVTAMVIGIFAILRMVVWGNRAYRKQNLILIAAYLIPLAAGLGTVFSSTRQPVDILPFSWCVSLILLGFLYHRDSLFKVAPVDNRLVFEALQDGLLVLDHNRVIVDYTAVTQQYMPELSAECIGVPLIEAAEHIALLKQFANQADSESNPGRQLAGICCTTDSKRWFEIREVAAKPHSSTFTLLLIRDITDWMNTVQALKESNRALHATNEFRSTVMQILSHDLRSPLVAMKAMKQLFQPNGVQKTPMLWEEASEELDELVDRSDMLINHLLLLADVPLSYPVTPIDSDTIIHALPPSLLRYAQRKGVKLTFEPEDCTLVSANMTLLVGALRIVVDNAIKFSYEGGSVVVQVIIQRQTVMFAVNDDGIGFDEASMHAFEADTWGVKHVGTAGEKGPGLGLYVARRCMMHMEGMLKIESKVGAGSTVMLIVNRAFPTQLEGLHD